MTSLYSNALPSAGTPAARLADQAENWVEASRDYGRLSPESRADFAAGLESQPPAQRSESMTMLAQEGSPAAGGRAEMLAEIAGNLHDPQLRAEFTGYSLLYLSPSDQADFVVAAAGRASFEPSSTPLTTGDVARVEVPNVHAEVAALALKERAQDGRGFDEALSRLSPQQLQQILLAGTGTHREVDALGQTVGVRFDTATFGSILSHAVDPSVRFQSAGRTALIDAARAIHGRVNAEQVPMGDMQNSQQKALSAISLDLLEADLAAAGAKQGESPTPPRVQPWLPERLGPSTH
jgi:hypothetical protein